MLTRNILRRYGSRKGKHEVEVDAARSKEDIFDLSASVAEQNVDDDVFLIHVPHGRRSKRNVPGQCKAVASESVIIYEENTDREMRQLPFVAPPFVPRRKQRKRSRSSENILELDDCEQALPSLSDLNWQGRLRSVNRANRYAPPKGKLNTNMFEHHLETLWGSVSEEKRDSFVCLDSLWFFLYANHSKAKVLNWIKKKDIFSKKYVFIPIVQWSHWSLLIFCHFGESLQSKTRTPCMLLLDSLKKTDPKRLEPVIRKFVHDIYTMEERPESRNQIHKIPFLVPKVPQQKNGEECGKFVLYFISLFVEGAPENFSTSDGYPYFMNEDWFTPEGLECFFRQLKCSD